MSETKFTPGPWRIEGNELNNRSVSFVILPVNENTSDAVIEAYNGTEAENEANARLIAQAPMMYAVLEEIKRVMDDPRTTASMPATMKRVNSILKAVDGEP